MSAFVRLPFSSFLLPWDFSVFGDVIAGAIYQTGQFTRRDSVYVWAILAGSAVGLLATTLGRLYASVYYALKDTRTPLRYAILRVFLTAILGYICALPLPPLLGLNPALGSSGTYRIGGALRMAGVSFAAKFTERTDRQDGSLGLVYLEIMGRRWSWCRRWLGGQSE